MSIILDAMGGDHAPREIVSGAVQAAPKIHHSIVLVGDPARIQAELPTPCPTNIEIHPASQVIEMHDKPLEALRSKKDSSMAVGVELVKIGRGQAFVSAGNTGAATAASLLSWRQLPGIHRPAIASTIPNRHGQFLLLDAGASPDVDPEHLVEFAEMGRAYAEKIMGRSRPKVHLLNIGEEPGKGNAFAKQAHQLLARYPWFAGNIEGKDMYSKPCDVVVCDAFVGNIVLKTSEGVAELILQVIKDQVPTNKMIRLAYLPLRKVLLPLKKQMDYAEYGGSPLLGLNGLCIIGHGRSNAKAIANALLLAQKAIDTDLVESIRAKVQQDAMGQEQAGG
ncbi:MAG: phosphate acyltransferase PlsX [Fimbriimonadaceae bacterium]|nr:phosphate acyltransferase PlsX [Chthonomonadaceae bacterium]MCO5295817.1 phosphate acyltransferase PlsX [Fimbriimonadaceae bacterium]